MKRSRPDAASGKDTAVLRGVHPYGVKPLGNEYFDVSSSGAKASRTADGLGGMRALSHELVVECLTWLDAPSLCRVAVVSCTLYAFGHADDLWRERVLEDFTGAFTFVDTWKQTYQGRGGAWGSGVSVVRCSVAA